MPESQNTNGPQKKPQSGNGPVVGILIILLVIVGAAFYFLREVQSKQVQNSPPPYIPGDANIPIPDASSSLASTSTTLD